MTLPELPQTVEMALPEDLLPNYFLLDGRVEFLFATGLPLPPLKEPITSYSGMPAVLLTTRILSAMEKALPDFFSRDFYYPTQYGAGGYGAEEKTFISALVHTTKISTRLIIISRLEEAFPRDNNGPVTMYPFSMNVEVALPSVPHESEGKVYGLDTSRSILTALLRKSPLSTDRNDGLVSEDGFNRRLYALVKTPDIDSVARVEKHADNIHRFFQANRKNLYSIAEALTVAWNSQYVRNDILGRFTPSADSFEILERPNRELQLLSAEFPVGILHDITAAMYTPPETIVPRASLDAMASLRWIGKGPSLSDRDLNGVFPDTYAPANS